MEKTQAEFYQLPYSIWPLFAASQQSILIIQLCIAF